MNALSWSLYAADALQSLKVLISFAAGLSVVGFGFAQIRALEDGKSCAAYTGRWVAFIIVAALLACALPSSQTVYLIAASEAGERVVSTPEGREMLELVRRRIREALTDGA